MPSEKHFPKFGQCALAQTVLSLKSESTSVTCLRLPPLDLTLIQSGAGRCTFFPVVVDVDSKLEVFAFLLFQTSVANWLSARDWAREIMSSDGLQFE